MNSKIAVIAGTPIDTEFGQKLMQSITSNEVLTYAVSETPKEQTSLQLNNPDKLFEMCLKKCLEFKDLGVTQIVFYCSSLSSAINIENLKKATRMNIITPLDVYENISNKYQNILILAANSVGTNVPEKIISRNNNSAQTTTIGHLALADQVEAELSPLQIMNKGLGRILKFAEKIEVDLIVLACTHFPYFADTLRSHSQIDIIDLNSGLKTLLQKHGTRITVPQTQKNNSSKIVFEEPVI